MKKRIVVACFAAVLLVTVNTGIVFAHASLQSCSIKSNQVFLAGHTPKSVQAFFAEPLDPTKSFIAVFENQADHGLVNEKTRSHVNFQNPKELTLQLPAIPKGNYYMLWYTHSSADGHFAAGLRYFSVR